MFYGFTVRLVGAPFFLPEENPTPVGAAAGCDLLMLFFLNQDQKIAAYGSSYSGGVRDHRYAAIHSYRTESGVRR
ncbi:hypothetical protein EMIT0P260_40367 [Pseudomonas sp. IT-P260]